jgi:dTDP-4-amino-4,6-dideoxygalactose transaminase
MPRVIRLAEKRHAVVVEDCAQAHGAAVNGRKCGAWGAMAAFSFYPTKNLGALGDGGAVVTADERLAARARLLREYGWRNRYISEIPGMNTRLDPLQAAILSVRLTHLESDNERRRDIARRYTRALQGAPVVAPAAAPGITHAYHQYVIRTSRRDEMRNHLAQRGIETAVLYPQPIHLQPAYRGRLQQAGSLQNSERVCGEILSLPVFPELSDAEVERVEEALSAWGRGG